MDDPHHGAGQVEVARRHAPVDRRVHPRRQAAEGEALTGSTVAVGGGHGPVERARRQHRVVVGRRCRRTAAAAPRAPAGRGRGSGPGPIGSATSTAAVQRSPDSARSDQGAFVGHARMVGGPNIRRKVELRRIPLTEITQGVTCFIEPVPPTDPDRSPACRSPSSPERPEGSAGPSPPTWRRRVGPRHRRPRRRRPRPSRRALARARPSVVAVAGDVTDPAHRRGARRRAAAADSGGLDLLVNNASTLGPTPLPGAGRLPARRARRRLRGQRRRPARPRSRPRCPLLRGAGGAVVNVTSDAAVEAYEGWGGYGSSKAALEQLSNVLAAEEPGAAGLRVRPRRHAHPDAPGRLPRRGHLRPARARDRRARAAPAARDGRRRAAATAASELLDGGRA